MLIATSGLSLSLALAAVAIGCLLALACDVFMD